MCAALKASIPDGSISNIPARRLMKIFCLSAFTVMLGRCCKGWGKDELVANQLRGQADGCSGCFLPQEGSSTKVPTVTQLVRGITQQPVEGQCRPKTAHRSMTGGKLDLGSFLIGVEISARDLDPERMAGVFGPLTNGWRSVYTVFAAHARVAQHALWWLLYVYIWEWNLSSTQVMRF